MTQSDTTTPVSDELLQSMRELQSRGLIDKLTPAERARALSILDSQMKTEREEALKPKSELLSRDPKPGNFIDSLMAPLRAAVEHPVLTHAVVARGLERSFNPLPLLNAPGDVVGMVMGKPPAYRFMTDVEEIEGMFNFPIIRGAELAARLFVDDDQQPDLTTFSEVVNNQREMDQQLRNIVPGVQEGVELGSAAAGFVQLGSAGLKLGAEIAKKSPQAARGLYQKALQMAATRSSKKTAELSRKLLRIGEGPFLDAIVQRPEKVAQLVNESGDLSINDITIRLKDELETLSQELGARVGPFREAAFADTKTRIKLPSDPQTGKSTIGSALEAVRLRTTFQGKSVLPAASGYNLESQLAAAERAAQLGVITPNQAMVWVDMLDGIIDFGNSGKPGSNAIKSANSLLLNVRGMVKNALRNASKDGATWANADDAFSGFMLESDGIIRRLETDGADSLVANLFGKNKTPLRGRLERALNYMEKIDPTAQGAGNAFFSRLADIKAAGRIKDVQLEINDPIADNVNRIVSKWRAAGQGAGASVGAAIGGAPGALMDSPIYTGWIGTSGLLAGRVVGGMAGEAVGKRIADPMRVIQSAIKSKRLSNDAAAIAKDVSYLTEKFGPTAPIAFFDLVGPIPAVKELIEVGSKVRAGLKQEKEE